MVTLAPAERFLLNHCLEEKQQEDFKGSHVPVTLPML